METFKPFIARVAGGSPLSRLEATAAFEQIMSGEATAAQIGAFLIALRVRGETVDEIAGAVEVMRAKMLRVEAPADAIDIVGTGGDGSGSVNVSTCAAFIVAGCGVPVAKHGNRAISSRSGAADVLAALGVNTHLTAPEISACIRDAEIGFMFAPNHHAAMRHVGPVRSELGIRTIFNLLGPLSNPAGVKRHLLGVFARGWVEPIAAALGTLGSVHSWVVHGSDGLDEITTTGPTTVAEVVGSKVRVFEISPADFGIPLARTEDLRGGDGAENAIALRAVLAGEAGPYRDIALLNAAAALVVADKVPDLAAGVTAARRSIDEGSAMRCLDRLVATSNRVAA